MIFISLNTSVIGLNKVSIKALRKLQFSKTTIKLSLKRLRSVEYIVNN